mgnify:CR=1 FL=1
MIEFREVTFAYASAQPVFERFNWSIGRGEAWAVIGGSGNGKTTLLMLLAGATVSQLIARAALRQGRRS